MDTHSGRVSPNFYAQWEGGQAWARGTIVRYGKDLYRAEGLTNTAEPGNSLQSRFYVSLNMDSVYAH